MILSCQDLAVNYLRIMITVSLPFLRLQKLFLLIGDLILSSDGRRFLQKEKSNKSGNLSASEVMHVNTELIRDPILV